MSTNNSRMILKNFREEKVVPTQTENERFEEYQDEVAYTPEEVEPVSTKKMDIFGSESYKPKARETVEVIEEEEEESEEYVPPVTPVKAPQVNKRVPAGVLDVNQGYHESPKKMNPENFEIAKMSSRKLKPQVSSQIKEIGLNVYNVEPVTISRIVDTEGHISRAIKGVEDKSGIPVLPFEVARILPQVEELKEHKIFYIKGSKYVSGTTRIVNKGRLDKYVSKIKECIMCGQVFDESLLENVTFSGHDFETLKFNHYELGMLNSLFININFIVYEDAYGDLRINVGGYSI